MRIAMPAGSYHADPLVMVFYRTIKLYIPIILGKSSNNMLSPPGITF
jgi:hypothetical protein